MAAWDDWLYWHSTNRQTLKRIRMPSRICSGHAGKPEPLKANLPGIPPPRHSWPGRGFLMPLPDRSFMLVRLAVSTPLGTMSMALVLPLLRPCKSLLLTDVSSASVPSPP